MYYKIDSSDKIYGFKFKYQTDNPYNLPLWDTIPFEKITFITFERYRLKELPPLDKLVNVEKLFCNHNQLKYLPDLSKLKKLKVLHCSFNQLEELPNLDELTELETLYCSHNNLVELPSLDKLQKLITLACRNNKITHLPSLNKMNNLIEFYCEDNEINTLPDMSNLVSLSYLGINDNNITELPRSIVYCKKLYEYELEDYYNTIDFVDEKINGLTDLIREKVEKYYYTPLMNFFYNVYVF